MRGPTIDPAPCLWVASVVWYHVWSLRPTRPLGMWKRARNWRGCGPSRVAEKQLGCLRPRSWRVADHLGTAGIWGFLARRVCPSALKRSVK